MIMKEKAENCCEGKVVSVTGEKLTSTCEKGHEHQHVVAKDAKVTCDGKVSKLSDLKAGTSVRMTTCKDDKNKVTAIESGKHLAASSH
jgi:hypothetical protein